MRGWTRRTLRALLLGGATLLAISGVAEAQVQTQAQTTGKRAQALPPAPVDSRTLRGRAPAPAIPDDGLGPRDMLLEADIVARDEPRNTVTATGHVQARYQGRTLRADKLTYNTVTGESHAVGHAVVVNPDGSVVYGDDVTLDDQFRAAVAIGFATRQTGNTTLTAGTAIRRNETVNQLNSAVYTACNICALDGSPRPPAWSISATQITQDRARQVIYYKNAVIRVLSVPVFYAPVFWHPDPTSPRRSGFLTPKIDYSNRRGFSYEQPYLFTLGRSADLIVSPQIDTKVNPFLNLRYSERFYSGMIDVRAGYGYDELFNSHQKYGDSTSRSYILARGIFDVTPDKNWVWGFGAERESDPTLFARYGIHNVYEDRGPFPADTDRLISQLYTVRADSDSYVSLSALDFQSVRAYGTQTAVVNGATVNTPYGIYESNRAFPIVGPQFEARYNAPNDFLGGQLSFQANAVALSRNNRVISVFDPSGTTVQGPQLLNTSSTVSVLDTLKNDAQNQISHLSGLSYTDSRRASLGGNWRSSFTLDNGIRIDPFVYGRGDVYSVTDPMVLTGYAGSTPPSGSGNRTVYQGTYGGLIETEGKSTVGRISGTAGANFSWPFIKPIGSASVVLEPLAQIALSPTYRVDPNIPNEDSAAFEYDETNLFSIDRFSGFDLLEGGQRLNVGGRATANWGAGDYASLLIGRTFRAEPDPQFTALSGLEGTSSDWVVAATAQPFAGFQLFSRSRLDKDSYELRREEAGVGYNGGRFSVNLRYDLNENGAEQLQLGQVVNGETTTASVVGQTVITKTEDISLGGYAFLTRHWGVSANVSRDMQENLWPIAQVGLIYDNECIRVDVLFTHDETYSNVLGSSNSVTFRISLSTLGGTTALAPNNNRGSR